MKKIVFLFIIGFFCCCEKFDDIEEKCFVEECTGFRISGSIYCAAHQYEFEKAENSYRRCAAYTKKGTRCKRKAEKGSIYCWQHK